jgi:epoxyqueuosine reductase
LADDSPFAAREFIAGKDAMTPATDILTLDQESFSAAFRKSPMKRAKLSGLTRNAVAVLRNVCRRAEPPALEAGTPRDDPPRRDPTV